MDLVVRESGAADGPLVVLVHGVLDTSRSFQRVVDLLEGECRLLRYDRRGYGASTGLAGTPADVPRHVADLVDVLDGRRAVVVGHSFGGVVAAGAAAAAPELVEAVLLYESVMAWAPGWPDTVMRRVLGSDDPEQAGLRLMLGDRYDTASERSRASLRLQARAFVAEEASTRLAEPPYDVGRITAPLLWACSDAFPAQAMRALLAGLPDATVLTVSGADHMAHRTAPEAFADLVREALRRRCAPQT